MMPGIEDSVVSYLHARDPHLFEMRVQLMTGRAFVLAVTDRGDVGVAMDYGRYQRPISDEVRVEPLRTAGHLLAGGRAVDVCDRLTEHATRVAVLNALSRRFLTGSALLASGFRARKFQYRELFDIRPGHRHILVDMLRPDPSGPFTAGVVGFGGLLEVLAFDPRCQRVRVADRHHRPRTDRIERIVGQLNRAVGHEKVSFVGPDVDQLRGADVLDLTASALCNGTLDDLLAMEPPCKVLTGPSGALAPVPIFANGVRMMLTELRPPDFADVYRFNEHLNDWYQEYDERWCITAADPSP